MNEVCETQLTRSRRVCAWVLVFAVTRALWTMIQQGVTFGKPNLMSILLGNN